MIIITVKPSSIWIEPYIMERWKKIKTDDDIKKQRDRSLEKSLSVYDVNLHRYTQTLYEFEEKYDNNTGILKIPRGYGVDLVEKIFKERGIFDYKIVYEDNSPEPRKVNITMRPNFSKPRDEYQEHAITFLQKTHSSQKFLSLSTGFGKTFCSIFYMSTKGVPSLIISKNLQEQWLEFVTDYTKCQNAIDVEILQGSKILDEYTFGKGASTRKHKVAFYITTIDTLRSFVSKRGPEALQKLANNLQIGVKFFDEAHSNYLLNNKIDLNMQVKETIYLTATPGRSRQVEDRVFKKIINKIPIHGEYTHNISQYYDIVKITFNSFPNDYIINRCNTPRGFSSKFYSEYMFSDPNKKIFVYALILDILIKIFKSDKTAKVLVLLDWLRDIQWLHDKLESNSILKSYGIEAGIYCSIIPNKDLREKELDNNIIIGTLGSMSAGHDISKLRAIIPFTNYSSHIIARQLLGRLRYIKGKALYYFDILDEGFPSMFRQRRERMKVFIPRANKVLDKYVTFDEILSTVTNKLQEK